MLLVIIGLVGVYKISLADIRIPARFPVEQISRVGDAEVYRIIDTEKNVSCYVVATTMSISCVK